MNSFTSELDLRDLGDYTFALLTPFSYGTITVPAGFITDFASVPRLLWNILPPYGPAGKAAVIHDYLYSLQGRVSDSATFTRTQCDAIFLEAMTVLHVAPVTRRAMWLGVRLGGWWGWNKAGRGKTEGSQSA